MKNFTVTATHTDHRLDKFLTEMTGQTRSHIQRQIKFGQVLVNGKKARVHEFLKLNDKVEVNEELKGQRAKGKVEVAERNAEKEGGNNKRKNLLHKIKKVLGKIPHSSPTLPKHLTPKVIFKCDEYLVIEKPAGLLVHETKISKEPTLVDWLVDKFPEISKLADTESLRRGDHTFRPGIVHRLDREVAGVMIVARTQNAFDHLKQQFKDHKVTKEYIALVYGPLAQDEGRIDFEISRKTDKGIMAAHPFGSGKGRPALTKYEVIQRFNNATLVKIKLETGRTNQIRVHFNALNHPLVGDTVYKQNKFSNSSIKSEKILLFARELKFTDPRGAEKTFSADMPEYFTTLINRLT
jgi:23S rRNA pseudouridine1911/1915/1917 synthase